MPLFVSPIAFPAGSHFQEELQLLAAGQSNPAIAAALVVTTGTIKSHTSRVYAKLGVTNRTQAVVRARTLGLLA